MTKPKRSFQTVLTLFPNLASLNTTTVSHEATFLTLNDDAR